LSPTFETCRFYDTKFSRSIFSRTKSICSFKPPISPVESKKILETGIKKIIIKPFRAEELGRIVGHVLDKTIRSKGGGKPPLMDNPYT